MALKVFSDKKNPNLYKILIAAKYNGVNVETPEFNVETDLKTLEKKNLSGKVPFLETEEGGIFGANAIARYVAKLGKNKLYGSNPFDAGTVEQWIDYAAHEIELPAAVWVYPILGIVPNNANATQRAKGDVRKVLENLNKHLVSRTFLVGQRISLADIVVAMSLFRLYELVLDIAFRKQFQNVNRWYTTIVNQPEVKSVVGNVVLCEKMQVAKEEKPVKEEKKEQPKKEQPKKEAKKKEEEE